MSYRIYTTDVFIITAKPSRDADIALWIFTEQLGLLMAIAKSARNIRSKLRYSLQSLTFSSISLVKGREVWRVTSAKKHISLYDSRLPIEYRSLFARMLSVVERFCPREQPEPVVFDTLRQISGFIFKESKQSLLDIQATARALESIFALRVLHELGYVTSTPELEGFLTGPISLDIVEQTINESVKLRIDQAVNKAIAESHL